MELQPPTAPLPPLFAALRRRHPDVDVVLLPPEPLPAETGELPAPADDDAVARATDRVAGLAAGAWAGLGGDGDPTVVTRFGPREDTVVARARSSARLGESPLGGFDDELTAAGWQVARPRTDAELVVARRDGDVLVASYAAGNGVLTLTVSSAPLRVGLTRARQLVRR